MTKLRLVDVPPGSDVLELARTLPQPEFELPVSALGRRYYRAVVGSEPKELSFAFFYDDQLAALVECDASHDFLGRFGSPIELRAAPNLPPEIRRLLARGVIGTLVQLAREQGLMTIKLRTTRRDDDGLLAARLLVEGASPVPSLRAIVDLSYDDSVLLGDMRKGHRQQVRWGERNLELRFVSAEEGDHCTFELFRHLHAEVAGRVTRDVSSWNVAYEALKAGQGDLILSYFEGALVGGTLVLAPSDVAYYSTGAYRRELFRYPLSHYPVFRAFSRARDGVTSSQKERHIAHFKRGFTGRTETSLVWELDLDRQQD
jgi:hypothetical protein